MCVEVDSCLAVTAVYWIIGFWKILEQFSDVDIQ
jgi:hypothetical protein